MKNKRSKVIHSLNDCSLNDGRMVAIENSESAVVYSNFSIFTFGEVV